MRQGRKLERIRAGRAAFRLPGDLEIDRRQRRAAARREGELLGGELVAVGQEPCLQAAGEAAELEQWQILAEPGAHRGERDVRRHLAQRAALDGGPEPQRALSALEHDRVVEPGAPGGEVGLAELGIGAAAPVRGLREARAFELRAKLERRAERLGQPADQADRVALAVVLQAKIDPGQQERRGRALLVEPLDLGAADLDFVLGEQPVAESGFARHRRNLHPGDVENAVAVAAHAQPQALDAQRVEAQAPLRERAP